MRFEFTHTIDTDLETFWRVYFDPEFNRALYLDHLRFSTYRVLEEREDAAGRHRRVECAPKVELPAAVRKLFGDSTGYIENGHFDASTRRYRVDAVPNFGGEKLKTSNEVWAEAAGAKRTSRHARGEAQVKVFGLGSVIEGLIEKQARQIYDESAVFMNRWIREKGL